MKPSTRPLVFLLAALASLGLAACEEDNPNFDPDPVPVGEGGCSEGRETLQEVTTFVDPSQIDVLFVLSDAPGSEAIQRRLAASIPRFVSLLRGEGLDFHIGVTTGNGSLGESVGALRVGGQDIADCADAPRLVTEAQGDSAGTFAACNVLQGESAASVQEPLEAMRAALTTRNTEPFDSGGNAGFLRARARLLVVFVTDRDDCSSAETIDPQGDGPTACERATNLTDIDGFAQQLAMLKGDPSAVSVALIGGSDDGRTLDPDETLPPTCSDPENTNIFPATRLISFVDAFRPGAMFESACAGSYGVSMAHIAQLTEPTDVIVCPEVKISGSPLSVSLDGNNLEQSVDGYVFLGPTDACDNGAIAVNAAQVVGADGALEIRFCGQ